MSRIRCWLLTLGAPLALGAPALALAPQEAALVCAGSMALGLHLHHAARLRRERTPRRAVVRR